VPVAAVAGDWAADLTAAGIAHLGILPLRLGSGSLSLVVLGLADHQDFDSGTRQLLEEMGAELDFAFEAMIESKKLKLAETRAEISERKFREIFEFAPLPMIVLTHSGEEMEYANRALYAWLGYQEGDITTVEQWFEQVIDDPQQLEILRSLWVQSLAAAHAKGGIFDYPEVILRCKDGTHVIGKARMTLVENHVVITYSDMTQTRNNEARLQESEKRFRAMIEQTLTPIFVRADERFIYVNPGMTTLMGYSAEELLEIDLTQLLAMETAEIEEIREARHPAPKTTSEYNLRVRRKDGIPLDLSIHLNNIIWDNKVAYIGIAEDVTERRKMLTELQNRHELLQKLAQQVPGVIYQFKLSPDGGSSFPFASEHIRDIYEVSPDDVKTDATKVFARLYPEDRKGVEDSIMESARTL
jgi:PAS domain S-box-containing protein